MASVWGLLARHLRYPIIPLITLITAMHLHQLSPLIPTPATKLYHHLPQHRPRTIMLRNPMKKLLCTQPLIPSRLKPPCPFPQHPLYCLRSQHLHPTQYDHSRFTKHLHSTVQLSDCLSLSTNSRTNTAIPAKGIVHCVCAGNVNASVVDK